jgi:hypothetical protein
MYESPQSAYGCWLFMNYEVKGTGRTRVVTLPEYGRDILEISWKTQASKVDLRFGPQTFRIKHRQMRDKSQF